MSNAFLLSGCRTPIGKFYGALSSKTAPELGAVAIAETVRRAGVEPSSVEEVIMGNVLPAGVGQAPARQAALQAGIPDSVAALTINKVCGSGLKAVMLASQAIGCGDAELILAGGMESMSQAPWLLPREQPPLGERTMLDSMMHDGLTCAMSHLGMGVIADRLAEKAGVSREDQDRFSAQSHQRAAAAIEAGRFDDEITPIEIQSRKQTTTVSRDEGPRPETTSEKLAGLRPAFGKEGSVTAGNASMISDGAAAVAVASESYIKSSGAKPVARIVASFTAGGAPEDLFTAPVAAVRGAVQKAGMSLADIDLFEINEAFAVQMLACIRQLEISEDIVNLSGGGISLGHPIGASGARVLVTLLSTLKQQDKQTGVAALCLGGGNAVAMVVERV